MNIPQSASDLFDNQLPEILTKNPDKIKGINAVYLFKITGDDGGTWTVDLASEPPTCNKGKTTEPQCTIEIAHSDFKAMLANPAVAMQLYFQGKLKVSGDMMLATKLQKLFAL